MAGPVAAYGACPVMWPHREGMIGRNQLTLAGSVVVVFLVADLIWLPFSRLTFAPTNASRIMYAALVLAALACVPGIVRRRLSRDTSRPAGFLLAVADGLSLLTRAAAFTVAMG